MKAWKLHEKAIALLFGGVRTGNLGDGREDVQHDEFSIECKERKVVGFWLTGGMRQTRRNAAPNKLPILVIHEWGSRHLDDIVCIRLGDFLPWHEGKKR